MVFGELPGRYGLQLMSPAACFALPEPASQDILHRKVNKLQRETHNLDLSSRTDNAVTLLSRQIRYAIPLTIRLLASPSLFLPSLLPAIGIACVYVVYITLPRTFHPLHHWGTRDFALPSLGFIAGDVIIVVIAVIRIKRHRRLRLENEEKELKSRLISLLLVWPFTGLGLFLYGWSVVRRMSWIIPMVSLGLTGAGVMGAIVSFILPLVHSKLDDIY